VKYEEATLLTRLSTTPRRTSSVAYSTASEASVARRIRPHTSSSQARLNAPRKVLNV
jgi:hypothetical protein